MRPPMALRARLAPPHPGAPPEPPAWKRVEGSGARLQRALNDEDGSPPTTARSEARSIFCCTPQGPRRRGKRRLVANGLEPA